MFELIFSEQSFWPFIIFSGVFGAIIGSFLNVAIYRLPIMSNTENKKNYFSNFCFAKKTNNKEIFNLFLPNSHCPNCHHELAVWQNIPIISFIILDGKCHYCEKKISPQYLIIELISSILTMILASRFGFGFLFISSLIFAYCLIIISAIDFEHQLIPVNIIFILIFSGLFVNYFELFTDIKSAVLGVVIGYSFFWIVNAIFKLIKKADGIGEGDFVLLAACGAWVGWQHLSIVVLISSLLCLVYAYILSKRGVEVKNIPLPYGPFIAIASLICLIYGNFLNTLV